MNKIDALKEAYLAGFNASREGCNGECNSFMYKGLSPEQDVDWCEDRDEAIKEILKSKKETK